MPSMLFLQLDGTLYKLTPIEPDPDVAVKAWRLTTGDHVYDVKVDKRGWVTCDCGDACKNDNEKACKHIKAAKEVGLLPRKGRQNEQF